MSAFHKNESNKDKNNLSHTNNNKNTTNKNFSPNSTRSYCIKESDFHINLHKLTTDNNNNKHLEKHGVGYDSVPCRINKYKSRSLRGCAD